MTEVLNAVFGGNKTGSMGYHGNMLVKFFRIQLQM